MAQMINIAGNQWGESTLLVGQVREDFTEKAKSDAELGVP